MTLFTTIYEASFFWKTPVNLIVNNPQINLLPDGSGCRKFKIKAVETEKDFSLMNSLVKLRYGWRGYKVSELPTSSSVDKFTISAIENDTNEVIGSITVECKNWSSSDIFSEELTQLSSFRLCEFTKLAVNPLVASKRLLASLFHVAYIIAYRLRGFDAIVIEVNPRHVSYYEKALRFTVLSKPKLHKTVDAPAVLMYIKCSDVMTLIEQFGGKPELLVSGRSFYAGMFSLKEEAAIIVKMKTKHDSVYGSVGES